MSARIVHPVQVPGIESERYTWGYWYSGPIAALAEAGLLREGCMPGDPGQRKRSASYTDAEGRHVWVRGRGKGIMNVGVVCTVSELKRRDRAARAAIDPDFQRWLAKLLGGTRHP